MFPIKLNIQRLRFSVVRIMKLTRFLFDYEF